MTSQQGEGFKTVEETSSSIDNEKKKGGEIREDYSDEEKTTGIRLEDFDAKQEEGEEEEKPSRWKRIYRRHRPWFQYVYLISVSVGMN